MNRILLAILAFVSCVSHAAAVQLVSQVSRAEVAITSSFQGETLTVFGAVEPNAGENTRPQGPFHVIITVTGPLQNRVTRRKSNIFGVWLNTDQVKFTDVPSNYQVLSDTWLDQITDPITLAENDIPLERQVRYSATDAGWWDGFAFGNELVRLMEENGQFRLAQQGVQFRSGTFYFAQVVLPSDAVPGPYLVRTYLFKDGELIADRSDGFTVRKIGFERFLGQAARQQPLLYGLVCVALALFTGWLGGIVFRR
ncbi:TIGR02186 family protein [Devosia sp.]|uniref:TIGR02186 family protein n=1 Tax=Devosia sp. TaxID=1871048 RepID=UPI003A90BCCE